MPTVEGVAELDHSSEFVWQVLRQPDRYAEMLPSVIHRSDIVAEQDNVTTLALTVGKKLVHVSYVCEIVWTEPMHADIRLIEGPFKQLSAHVTITPLSPFRCRAAYGLDCQLNPALLETFAQKLFDAQLPKAVDRIQQVLAAEASAGR